MRFLFIAQWSRALRCPLGDHAFSPLDALGGDVAALDRPYEPEPIYSWPECAARVIHSLPLMGEPYWRLAPGQKVVSAHPQTTADCVDAEGIMNDIAPMLPRSKRSS